MAELKWQDPPSDGRARKTRAWDEVATELHAKPGHWALVGEDVSNSFGWTAGKTKGLERRTVLRPNGKFDIYMRAVES